MYYATITLLYILYSSSNKFYNLLIHVIRVNLYCNTCNETYS